MAENTDNPLNNTGFESETEILLSAITTDSLTDEMRARVEHLVRTDSDFQKSYMECIEMDALLRFKNRNLTENLQRTAPTGAQAIHQKVQPKNRLAAYPTSRAAIAVGIIAVLAACILVAILVSRPKSSPSFVKNDDQKQIIEHNGWTIKASADAKYELVDESQIKLTQGELFASSLNDTASKALTVSTRDGDVTANDSRFYVSCSSNDSTESNTLEQSLTKASGMRLLVLSGAAIISNSAGKLNVIPGQFITARRGEAPTKMQDEGNYREAFDVYKKLIVDADHTGKACRTDLDHAWDCLAALGRVDEWDTLAEKVVETHSEDWEVLYAVALRYWYAMHHGIIIDNQFQRAALGGRPVNTSERDRIRALQIMKHALAHLPDGPNPVVSNFYFSMSNMIRGHRQLWNLQTLTDIDRLPEYGEPVYWSHNAAPPVDQNDNPIFYNLPDAWSTATNDGERWRWLLNTRVKVDPNRELETKFGFADFLHGQFGVHTSGVIDQPQLSEGELPKEGRYTTHTLNENESIARLATGIRRFELPEGHNFVSIYKQIAKTPLDEPANPLSKLSYKVYHGSWDKLPDFAKLDPVKSGDVSSGLFDLDVSDRTENYGVVFEGEIDVPENGDFHFGINSDDGSRLSIDGEQVINYDGLHGMDHRAGKIKLKKGKHSIRLEYFQHLGSEGLMLTWSGPRQSHQYLSRQRPSMSYQEQALEKLAYIHENRRQFEKSAALWEKCIERFGTGSGKWRRAHYQQLVGNWLRFDSAPIFPSGQKATLSMKFRNANSVRFTARRVDIERVIADSKSYLKSDPHQLSSNYQIFGIGERIVGDGQKKYLTEDTIGWTQKLDPPSGHWTRQIEIETPLDEAGVYLVEATAKDGNTSQVLCWITDTTIVMKKTDQSQMYFVADSTTGQPIDKANVEVFAFWSRHDKETGRHYTRTKNFSRFTDEDGLMYTDADDVDDEKYSRIVIARDEETGRFGFLGDYFRDALQPLLDNPYQQAKAWCTTDRPVYRPGQHIHYKSWIRLAQYDLDHVSMFGGKEFTVAVFSPDNKEIVNKKVRTDEYGGLAFDWLLEEEAMLGSYRFDVIANDFTQPSNGVVYEKIVLGSGNFRVEEYKKPEYEVTIDAPSEAITLGEKFSATIKANYYFGAPVTNASVKYTVKRTNTADTWFPNHGWDWFYGEGHWWWGYNYRWYPGWSRWCLQPVGWFHSNPPEIILENTVPIGNDGTVKIEIDSLIAKERFGDTDHRYQITAEVVDDSRRTVTGNGSVVAARNPYNVYVWMSGGHFRVGDQMDANVQARTANGKGVAGKGEVTLYRIVFDDDGKPNESKVESWPIETDEDGKASLSIQADQPGQYRLACDLADAKGQKREGAALTRITGSDDVATGNDFRFDDLELVLDKSAYKPGDRARLLINTNHADSTIALFVRPANGIYTRPKLIRLKGKSTVHEIEIDRKDMPNIHVEAFLVSQGKFYQISKQITVPPEKRVLTLDIEPSKEKYEPGEKAKVKLRLTDSDGKPFSGSTVVAIYDKSLEAIAVSTAADIRSHFWRWHRGHHIYSRVSFQHRFGQLLEQNQVGMADLGMHWVNHWGGRYAGRYDRFSRTRGVPNHFYQYDSGIVLGSATATYFKNGFESLDFAEEYKAIDPITQNLSEGSPTVDAEPSVRSRFADTALWIASITTNDEGFAEIELEMPENLTTWKIKAWSMGHGTRVGHGEAEVITSKDVMIRLQAPRFFTESDEVTLSANVHNYTGQARDFEVAIELPGEQLALIENAGTTQTVRVEPDGDKRVDWKVRALNEGAATVRVKATTTDGKGDAMEQSYPVFVHGILKTDSHSLAIRGNENSKSIDISVPEKRRVKQTSLEVRYSPSIALSLVDALPYLAANPYKNSEAAMSRFGPLVTLRKVLTEMGIDLSEIRDKQINLNPQEIGDAKERAAGWARKHQSNPIFDEAALNKLVERSLRDLTTLQNQDGGWGWYAGHHSNAHTTAYVVHGLQIAEQNGTAIVPGVIQRGLAWLQRYQDGELKKLQNADGKYRPWKSQASNTDAFVFMVLVDADRKSEPMGEILYRDRLQLSPYAQAMIGLAMDKLGDDKKRDMIVRNLSQFLEQDPENQTASLQLTQNCWWCWYGSDIETNAYYLKLLCRTGHAKGAVAPGLAKYLLNNRKHATHWNSSRDTSIVIEALAEYCRESGETDPDMTVSILIDGELKKEVKINKENLFSFDNVLRIEGAELSSGDHKIEIQRAGKGPVYANAYLTNFTMEDFITKAGLEIKVERRYYKLTESKLDINAAGSRGNVVDYRVNQWTRTPLENGDTLSSGDLIEVELILESKNDYEYLQFSDRKAAGFEATTTRSGHRWLGGVSAYMELRDERVDFFIQRLTKGRHSLTYRLRAEVPGNFSALPADCNGVYAPELRANSDEGKLNIK